MTVNAMENGITFCEYTPQDYEGFVACINDFYHGGYPYTRYLDADYLKRKTADGSMIVTLAKTADGKIVGTSAAQRLTGVFEGSILLLLRCVLKECQGKGIATKQEYFLFDLIAKRYGDALSLYADVMTHNDASQKTLSKQGFCFCGMRMMLYKSEIMVPLLHYPDGTKMSQAVYCKAIAKKDVRIFAPDEHKEFIKRIYGNLGIKVEFLNGSAEAQKVGVYNISDKKAHFSAELYIEKPAADFTAELLPKIKDFLARGFTFVAYVNATYADSIKIYEQLLQLGFYFTGIKPLSKNGEYLILSHTANCLCSYENISISQNNREYLNYIIGGEKNGKD